MKDTHHILGAPLAAIDMGSNSFRIEIAHICEGRYRRLDYLKEPVRLGSGLDDSGYLRPDAVERGLTTLAAMSELLRLHEVREVRAVATQTLREARNRNQFLAMAEPVLGVPIEVISGREEARLIFAGVAHLNPSEKQRIVIDIGGRSTEFVMGQGLKPEVAESFGIGSQSMTQRYFGDGILSAEAFRAAQVAAGAEFEEAEKIFTPDRWSEALASSGTAGAVSALLAAHGVTDGRLTPSALAWCMERCIEAGHIDRLDLRGLKDERKPVLAGGLAILYTLMVQFRIDEIRPSRAALRQGVIFDLHQRRKVALGVDAHDVRDATVAQLQQRFEVDVAQAKRVKHLALNLQRHLLPDLPDEDVRELAWACDLHEIGLMVSHHDHHRHSAYLLDHLDAAGFSQSQQRRIGELVLGQRGGLRKVEAGFARKDFALVLLCLRLAVLCCHGRHQAAKVKLHVKRDLDRDRDVMLSWGHNEKERRLSPAELRTQHLLREEVAVWLKSGLFKLRWAD